MYLNEMNEHLDRLNADEFLGVTIGVALSGYLDKAADKVAEKLGWTLDDTKKAGLMAALGLGATYAINWYAEENPEHEDLLHYFSFVTAASAAARVGELVKDKYISTGAGVIKVAPMQMQAAPKQTGSVSRTGRRERR